MAIRMSSSRADIGPKLLFPVDGIARLLAITTVTERDSQAHFDALVEAEPAGAPLTARRVADPRAVGHGLASIVARAHAAGLILGGIRPELVYADGNVCTELAPRAETFHAAAPFPCYGVAPTFDSFYMSPEAFALRPTTTASDVFSLCATLVYLFDGVPPFEGRNVFEQAAAALHGEVRLVTVAPVIRAGLDPDPARRPDCRAIAEALQPLGGR
jgi:serine/threonine protein kinase